MSSLQYSLFSSFFKTHLYFLRNMVSQTFLPSFTVHTFFQVTYGYSLKLHLFPGISSMLFSPDLLLLFFWTFNFRFLFFLLFCLLTLLQRQTKNIPCWSHKYQYTVHFYNVMTWHSFKSWSCKFDHLLLWLIMTLFWTNRI